MHLATPAHPTQTTPPARNARPASRQARRSSSVAPAALAVAGAALLAILGYRSLPGNTPQIHAQAPERTRLAPAPPLPDRHGDALTTADGLVPDGATVLDDELPAIANLDPALLDALRRAAADAASDGITLTLSSGWRSPAYQEQLLQDAVADHGSRQEAARWVATPATSLHVAGQAADIGPPGAAWLLRHGAGYGLCPVYDNEPWHYELRPEAAQLGCPPRYADPTQDPRLQ